MQLLTLVVVDVVVGVVDEEEDEVTVGVGEEGREVEGDEGLGERAGREDTSKDVRGTSETTEETMGKGAEGEPGWSVISIHDNKIRKTTNKEKGRYGKELSDDKKTRREKL